MDTLGPMKQKLMHLGSILHRRAKKELVENPKPLLTGPELKKNIGRLSSASGVDLIAGEVFQDLPGDAWEDLAAECNRWEQTLALPLQAVVSLLWQCSQNHKEENALSPLCTAS